MGVDTDLPGGPVLFIWPPSPANDKPWRKFQHFYLPFAYSLLFVLWRVDSVKVAWGRLRSGNANGTFAQTDRRLIKKRKKELWSLFLLTALRLFLSLSLRFP